MAARDESADKKLLHTASRLIAKLKSEREVQRRIAETAPLCEISTFKDAGGKENLPPWSFQTDEFEELGRCALGCVLGGIRPGIALRQAPEWTGDRRAASHIRSGQGT